MPTIICLGELLIDFICEDIDTSLAEGKHFLKKAGGAPANVSAAVAKLGGHAVFAGMVGADPFGDFLAHTLTTAGVDTTMLHRTHEASTTFAFVSLQADGERDFVFTRGADIHFSPSLLNASALRNASVLHLGSATALLGGSLLDSYRHATAEAVQNEQLLSFDPNYRTDLWRGATDRFVARSREMLAHADLVKVSNEEAMLIAKKDTLLESVAVLHELGAVAVAITLGKDGTFISTGAQTGTVPSVSVKAIDATGAGDAFVGGLLFQVAQQDQPKAAVANHETLAELVAFANRVGAIACTKMGAIAALPTLEEVLRA